MSITLSFLYSRQFFLFKVTNIHIHLVLLKTWMSILWFTHSAIHYSWCWIFPVLCVLTGCVITASDTVAISPTMCTFLLASNCLTTTLVLLRNSLQWWKPLYLPHLYSSYYLTTDSNWSVRFEVFMAVPMANAVFWDVTPCSCCKNRCFRGTYRLLMVEAIRSSETRATRHHMPEDCLLKTGLSLHRLCLDSRLHLDWLVCVVILQI
jgi:hypothetical protein